MPITAIVLLISFSHYNYLTSINLIRSREKWDNGFQNLVRDTNRIKSVSLVYQTEIATISKAKMIRIKSGIAYGVVDLGAGHNTIITPLISKIYPV